MNLKRVAEYIPPSVGVLANYLPFSYRLGNLYTIYKNNLISTQAYSAEEWNDYVLRRTHDLLSYYLKDGGFYVNFLREKGSTLMPANLNELPLCTKGDLKQIELKNRSNINAALGKFNTGGTSGTPLTFYLEKGFYAREWAHIHYMWSRVGYNPTKIKITIRGKKLDRLVKYNFNQNEFLINAYHKFTEKDYREIYSILKSYRVEFIHGYPSAIYNFLKDAERNAPYIVDFLKIRISGILFSSEFPAPVFREYIEERVTSNTISWYGHTEGVILAGELNEKYEYVPLLSYGHAEAVKMGDEYHLVGTSFDNLASPFIRYDTEDSITPSFDDFGNLASFRINNGRIGEFVIDKEGHNISLTSLIFGRHHRLFDVVDFIQVKQVLTGEIIVYYSSSKVIDHPEQLFDAEDLSLNLTFQQIEVPFKTGLGKIPLLVK